jgi:hypothetical protein
MSRLTCRSRAKVRFHAVDLNHIFIQTNGRSTMISTVRKRCINGLSHSIGRPKLEHHSRQSFHTANRNLPVSTTIRQTTSTPPSCCTASIAHRDNHTLSSQRVGASLRPHRPLRRRRGNQHHSTNFVQNRILTSIHDAPKRSAMT